ncbi:hypothetical protein QLS71_010170 [Mariniflexile litorale]|uniref:DUF2306 domain-containing protein n=1 Tax=Mariniflexile litorale TaxID=3045158 RepID=A0AAU7EAR1_9FLAO|nr:hypothetical protein [Mariniflexile sp. KMM 9835]MDQ8213407.1 hypothetical protein [Mariniflexile sp. KMM 9835]
MNILKQILIYLIWTFISLLSAFGYMRIILGPKPKPSTGFMKMFDWTYGVAMLHVGSIIGSIIALLYIIIDVFYLKKRLKNNSKRMMIRFIIILIITLIVGTTHYIFEKVIDII